MDCPSTQLRFTLTRNSCCPQTQRPSRYGTETRFGSYLHLLLSSASPLPLWCSRSTSGDPFDGIGLGWGGVLTASPFCELMHAHSHKCAHAHTHTSRGHCLPPLSLKQTSTSFATSRTVVSVQPTLHHSDKTLDDCAAAKEIGRLLMCTRLCT